MVFPKKIDLFCIIGKDDIPLFRKYDLIDGKWKIIFLKKYMEISFLKGAPPLELEQ